MNSWGMISALTALVMGQEAYTASVDSVAADTGHEIIALDTEANERMTVSVSIMGQGPFEFIIDTGAQVSVLSRELADHLAIHEREAATLVALNSSRAVQVVDVPDVALGSREFDIYRAPLIERENLGGADGMLGLDSLQDQRVMLDFENNHLAVAPAKELGGNRGFEIVVRARRRSGQLIITNATLDGVRVAVMIDTGAQSSTGNLALLERLRNSRAEGVAVLTDVNGVSANSKVRVTRSLNFGTAKLENVLVTFADSPTFEMLDLADEPALILGMAELRLFNRVAVDFEKRRLLFDIPGNRRRNNRRSG